MVGDSVHKLSGLLNFKHDLLRMEQKRKSVCKSYKISDKNKFLKKIFSFSLIQKKVVLLSEIYRIFQTAIKWKIIFQK